MKKESRFVLSLLLAAASTTAMAQPNVATNNPPPLAETNIYQAGVQSFITNGASPANMQAPTNPNQGAGAAPMLTNQVVNSATNPVEKPAVHVTLEGTVLSPAQKAQIEQQLKEIPGIVMINDHIHVVGEIGEAAGAAARTNTPPRINTPSKQQKHQPKPF